MKRLNLLEEGRGGAGGAWSIREWDYLASIRDLMDAIEFFLEAGNTQESENGS